MPFLFTPNANMYIDQYNGIIGIGTNTPTSNLHIIGSSLITGNLNVSGFTSISNVSFSSSIALTGLIVSGNVGFGTSTSNANLHVVGPVNLISSVGNTGLYMRLGNVGIGTATPNANLHVMGYTQILGTTGISGLFIDTVGEVGINTSAPTSNLHVLGTTQILGTSGQTGMYVNTLGNIGIGTAVPQGNLHVLGHTRLLNNLNNTGLYVNQFGNVGIGTSAPNGNLHVLGYSQILGISGTNGLYVSNVGNVGIGLTNPQYNLDILGTMRTSNVTVFQGATTMSTFGAILGMEGQNCTLQLNANVGNDTYIDFSTSGSDYLGRIMYSSTANVMLFSTRLTEKMRIDAGGNVGINSSTPTSILDVNGNINTSSNYLRNGLTLAYGVFSLLNPTNLGASTDLTWTSIFNNNLTLSTSSVIQLPQQGVYRFEIMLNFTTGVNGAFGISMNYSTSSGGTYTTGLAYDNGYTSGTGGNTTLYYSYLYLSTFYSNSLFVKFTTTSVSSTGTFDTNVTSYWSRMQIHQIV